MANALVLRQHPSMHAGKGEAAQAVQRIMSRMRAEQGRDAPAAAAPGEGIDTLVLLDRSVDLVTPMCTQVRRLCALGIQQDEMMWHGRSGAAPGEWIDALALPDGRVDLAPMCMQAAAPC